MIENSDTGAPPTVDARAETSDGAVARGTAPAVRAPVSPSTLSSGAAPAATGTMTITFKLYATLQDLLPAGAVKNAVAIDVAADATLNDIIDRHKVPRELAHLVLVNGVFVCDADRDAPGALKPGDVLAIWPPVAGG